MLYVMKATCFVLGLWCQREITLQWDPTEEADSYIVMYEDAPCSEKNTLTYRLAETRETRLVTRVPAKPEFVRCFAIRAKNAKGMVSEESVKAEARGQ